MNHAYVRTVHGITWKIVPQPPLRWRLCCDLHDRVSMLVAAAASRDGALEYVAKQRTGVAWWDRMDPAHLPPDIGDLRSWRQVPYPDTPARRRGGTAPAGPVPTPDTR